jgi:hydroxyacylglutathione hydrolase
VEVRNERIPLPSGELELVTLYSIQPFQNNVYVLSDPHTRQTLVIDASEAAPILEAIDGRDVQAVLVTHGHRDHHHQLTALRLKIDAPVGINAADAAMLEQEASFVIEDGQVFVFGPHRLRAIHTPGHTPGSTCFLIGHLLLSGDTLFPGGPGNTSNRYGNFETIIGSIRERLFALPDDTLVLPGHGRSTTIGTERPHLDEWVAHGW